MTMVLWIMVIVFDVSAIAVLTVWGRLENEVLIAAVVMSVFLLAIGIFAILSPIFSSGSFKRNPPFCPS